MSKTKTTKKVKASEMTKDKILTEISAKKKELMSLRFKLKLGELTDTSHFKKAKKTIAKLYTELNRKKIEGK